jgi:hypothetical protein
VRVLVEQRGGGQRKECAERMERRCRRPKELKAPSAPVHLRIRELSAGEGGSHAPPSQQWPRTVGGGGGGVRAAASDAPPATQTQHNSTGISVGFQ